MSRVISVIAGGWSFRAVDHAKVPGDIIAVNDALVYLERKPNYVVSMDRLWTENRWEALKEAALPSFIRQQALKNIKEWHQYAWLRFFVNENSRGVKLAHEYPISFDLPMSDQPFCLNGTNSGACAINLAYLKKPTELYLFGFDFNVGPDGRAHWYPPYPWADDRKGANPSWLGTMDTYKRQFEEIGTKVYNVSTTSMCNAFQKVSPVDVGCAR